MTPHIHVWAILVAYVVRVLAGIAWYSPAGFGQRWAALVHLSPVEAMPTKAAICADLIGALLIAFLLGHVADQAGATTIAEGALMGFGVWLGFIGPVTLSIALHERRPFALFVLNSGYQVVTLVIMGAIVAAWRG